MVPFLGLARTGWFVQLPIIGGLNEPPRLRPLRWLRRFFLMGAATPPLPRRGVFAPKTRANVQTPAGGHRPPLQFRAGILFGGDDSLCKAPFLLYREDVCGLAAAYTLL